MEASDYGKILRPCINDRPRGYTSGTELEQFLDSGQRLFIGEETFSTRDYEVAIDDEENARGPLLNPVFSRISDGKTRRAGTKLRAYISLAVPLGRSSATEFPGRGRLFEVEEELKTATSPPPFVWRGRASSASEWLISIETAVNSWLAYRANSV